MGFELPSPMISLRLFRRSVRRSNAILCRGSLSGSPIFFANSFPKSGTHLLTQVLHGFTSLGPAVNAGLPAVVMFDGPTGDPRSVETVVRDLNRFRPGDIGYGHLHATPEVKAVLTGADFASYFIYRDPRDVVVSHVHYVTSMASDHVHHHYYSQTLTTFEQRLKTSILGLPDIDVPFPNIYRRFEPYLGWLEEEQVLSLRFEDFIKNREQTLDLILDHARDQGFQINTSKGQALNTLESSIKPEKSPTYRSGSVGKWCNSFSQENKALFKEIAGNLLIKLGYEKDHDW